MKQTLKTILGGRSAGGSAARSVAWNYAGYVFQIGVSLGTTAYIVRRVSVSEYGLLLFVLSLSAGLYLLDMGLSSVLVQCYVSVIADRDRDRLNELMSTVFWALAMLGFLGVLIFSGLAAILPGPFKIPGQYVHEASLIFVIAALVIQVGLPRIALEQVYQASNRYDRINQVQLLTTGVQFVLSVLVLAAGYRIVALVIVQLAVAAFNLLLLIVALPASVPEVSLRLMRFRWTLLKPVIHLSKWAFLDNLSVSLFNVFAWSILGSWNSMTEVAMFGLAARLPRQLRNAVEKGAHVTLPRMSEQAVDNDIDGLQMTFLTTQKIVFGVIFPFILLGCVFARPLIEVWAGGGYVRASVVMQLLLLATMGDSIAYSSGTLLYASGRVKRAALISLFGNIAAVCGILLTVSRYGAVGIAASIAVTQVLVGGVWFTVEACKACHASPLALVRAALRGVVWPAILMLFAVAIVLCFFKALAPLWLVLAAVAIGSGYLWLWGARVALPLLRNRTEEAL